MIQRKKDMLRLLLAALLCAGLGAAQISETNETGEYGVKDAASELGLATFSSALDGAGLTEILDNKGVLLFGSGTFVVFAPDDEAFSSLADSGIMENQTELKRVLSYHVAWNDGLYDNITEVSSLRTLQGESLTVNSTDGLKVNGANVTRTKEYDSGTIYVIDRVLVPAKSSSQGVVEAADYLGVKKFASAIKAAGFVERLNGQGLMGIESLREGPFTIFAPSDEAFDKAKTALDSISKKDAGTRTLLSYHMVDASALINRTDSNSVKTLEGDSLGVDATSGLVGGARVLRSERYDNGIIYVIDQLLVPVRLSM
ncbi:MAG: fasciclin domain-containing protein [Methanothrix sp.]|nr:fasciclin domain-containing protein [Methanothrix sp.]